MQLRKNIKTYPTNMNKSIQLDGDCATPSSRHAQQLQWVPCSRHTVHKVNVKDDASTFEITILTANSIYKDKQA